MTALQVRQFRDTEKYKDAEKYKVIVKNKIAKFDKEWALKTFLGK